MRPQCPDHSTQLQQLIYQRALQFGDFKLASGKTSKFYLDCKQVTLYARSLQMIADGLFRLIKGVDYTAVGGMSTGADALVSGVLMLAAERGRELTGFYVRKEAKEHGTKRYIEGPVLPGSKVIILEDVVTTGGSSLAAIDRIQEFGCTVMMVAAVVDRQEGGSECFAERGIPFASLYYIKDFLEMADVAPDLSTEPF